MSTYHVSDKVKSMIPQSIVDGLKVAQEEGRQFGREEERARIVALLGAMRAEQRAYPENFCRETLDEAVRRIEADEKEPTR